MTNEEAEREAKRRFGKHGAVINMRDGSDFMVGVIENYEFVVLGSGATYELAFEDTKASEGEPYDPNSE